jgi:flagellin-like protein
MHNKRKNLKDVFIYKEKKMVKRFRKKSGLSPIITTVLLIALTLVITTVVFLWFRGMVEEGVTKFGKNIKLVCDDVDFDASYSSGVISIVNNGNVPLFRVNLKISKDGSYQTKDIKDLSSNWPDVGLAQGGAFSEDIESKVGNAEKILIVPVLIGTSSSGKKTFICEGQYGKEITL